MNDAKYRTLPITNRIAGTLFLMGLSLLRTMLVREAYRAHVEGRCDCPKDDTPL